jgi:hypothetical protein
VEQIQAQVQVQQPGHVMQGMMMVMPGQMMLVMMPLPIRCVHQQAAQQASRRRGE